MDVVLGIYRRPRHLSRKGAEFIGRFEGWRSTPYNDPAGHATIGFGHLIHLGPVTNADRAKWRVLTRAQGEALLVKDAERFSRSVRASVKPKINQAQHDALVSFAFNVGTGAFESSTLLRMLNAWPGTRKGVVGTVAKIEVRQQLMRWSRAGGQMLPGLARRRREEANLFSSGRYR